MSLTKVRTTLGVNLMEHPHVEFYFALENFVLVDRGKTTLRCGVRSRPAFARATHKSRYDSGDGSFEGARKIEFLDYFFFSSESFSALGLGDIYPVRSLRMLASIESINGLLLIGWSTSFTFLTMQRYWFLDEAVADKTISLRSSVGRPSSPIEISAARRSV